MEEKKELTVPERAAVALGAAEHEKALVALATKYSDITKIVNTAGREQCHSAYMELKNARVAIVNAGKAAREDAVAFQKAVIAEADRLALIVEPEQGRLQKLRDDFDSAREAEKAAIAAAEKARVDAIRAKIDAIRNTPARLVGKSSADIGVAADRLSETVIALTEYAEFSGECQVERDHAVKKLREMQEAQRAVEAEAQRLAEERAALEAERRAQAERDKQIREARELDERLAREARERAAEKQRAEHEAAEAKLRAEREAAEAELRKQREEIARQQAEIDRQRAEAARIERERQEAIEAEARAKREAEEAAAKLEADHAEALIEHVRIDAERRAAFEAQQQEAQRRADEAERIRREHTKFIINGPGDIEIVKVIAEHYDVELGDAMEWIKKFDYAAADEYFAAANVAANQLEKAA